MRSESSAGKTDSALKELVVKAYKEHPHACSIAARFGVHHSTVKAWVRKAGAEPPDECDGGVCAETGGAENADEPDVESICEQAAIAYLVAVLSPRRVKAATATDALAVLKVIKKARALAAKRRFKDDEEDMKRHGLKPWQLEVYKITGWQLRKLKEWMALPEEERARIRAEVNREREKRHKGIRPQWPRNSGEDYDAESGRED